MLHTARKIVCIMTGSNTRPTCSVVWPPCIPDVCVANETSLNYRINSPERKMLAYELNAGTRTCEEIPIVIGNEYIYEGEPRYQGMPHDHQIKVAKYYHASEETITKAINFSKYAQCFWDRTPLQDRIYIWQCAAELLATTFRQHINASTMMGQGKTVIQSEFDTCDLVDLFRFNAFYLKEHAKIQPTSENCWETLNSMRFRGIDGFVAAITPPTYTSAAASFAYTPALMGNSVLWKPDDNAILSSWRIFNVLREAGLPAGVVNFVPADNCTFAKTVTKSPYLAGLSYSGSNGIFDWYWKTISKDLNRYINYPRMIGECGGNSYHFVHESADVETVVACTIRSAFEFSGQKNSSCKRLYVPHSLHKVITRSLVKALKKLTVGNVHNFRVFTGAVINEKTFDRVIKYIDEAKNNKKNKVLFGGDYDKKVGYYIEPTVIETFEPRDKLLTDVINGPVLTIYTYDEKFMLQALSMVKTNSKYAMAGSLFATDACFLFQAIEELRDTAGSLHINDKSTSCVVGHQLRGGGHKAGTNDKIGGPYFLLRFTSPQTIKEKFVDTPLTEIWHPSMVEDSKEDRKRPCPDDEKKPKSHGDDPKIYQ